MSALTITYAIMGVVAGIVLITIFFYYISGNSSGVDKENTMSFVEPASFPTATIENNTDYSATNLINLKNMTLAQVKELNAKVCGGLVHPYLKSQYLNASNPSTYSDFLPQQANFTYLKPKNPIMKIPCTQTPLGPHYVHFTIDENGTATAVNLGQGKNVFYGIETPEQALEYVENVHLYENSGFYIFKSSKQFDSEYSHCEILASSPVKMPTITQDANGDDFIVKIPVMDYADGLIVYEKWQVDTDTISATLLEEQTLGNCHSAV